MSEDKPGRIKYAVTYTDGSRIEAFQTVAAEVAFERRFDVSVTDLMLKTRAEWIYYIAWKSSKSGDEFDAWLDRVDTIDVADETDEGEADPLDPTPPPGD